jgi:hypothetical protein
VCPATGHDECPISTERQASPGARRGVGWADGLKWGLHVVGSGQRKPAGPTLGTLLLQGSQTGAMAISKALFQAPTMHPVRIVTSSHDRRTA